MLLDPKTFRPLLCKGCSKTVADGKTFVSLDSPGKEVEGINKEKLRERVKVKVWSGGRLNITPRWNRLSSSRIKPIEGGSIVPPHECTVSLTHMHTHNHTQTHTHIHTFCVKKKWFWKWIGHFWTLGGQKELWVCGSVGKGSVLMVTIGFTSSLVRFLYSGGIIVTRGAQCMC